MSENFNSSNGIIHILIKNIKPIIWLSLAAAIISAIISLIIPEKYKSTVILYPANTSSISKALINQNSGAKTDLLEFGEEEKTEQLQQILNSDRIRNEVIKKFNLMQHYEIDSTSETKMSELNDRYESNIKYKRNEFMAVEIVVMDEDKVKAAQIANGIAEILDEQMNNIQKERAMKGLQIVERSYFEYTAHVKRMEDSLKFIMSLGVHDFEKQSEVLTEAYADAVSKNNQAALKAINEKLDLISKYGAQQYNLKNELKDGSAQLTFLKDKYEQAKIDANEKITNFFVVDHATPAEKKSYPMRSLIVLLSTVCTALFAFIVLLVNEKIKEFK